MFYLIQSMSETIKLDGLLYAAAFYMLGNVSGALVAVVLCAAKVRESRQ